MSDLISRKALLEEIQENHWGWFSREMLLSMLENQPSVTCTNSDKWIPCSERLPKIRESLHTSNCVLTTMVCDDGNIGVRVGFYHREIGWVNVTPDEKVIAWMPLPEPYEGE